MLIEVNLPFQRSLSVILPQNFQVLGTVSRLFKVYSFRYINKVLSKYDCVAKLCNNFKLIAQ